MDYGSLFRFPSIMPDVHPMDEDDKRWSFQEEIIKLFNASLNGSFPDFKEEACIRPSQRWECSDYNCQNALTIWPKINKSPHFSVKYQHIQRPRDIGEVIKKDLQTLGSDMIDKYHSVQDVGFVPFSLSRKWLAKSIHMMLKDGIKTWAPKLPVERVVVQFPTLDEENCVGVSRREAIRVALVNMLEYSKVQTYSHKTKRKDTELRNWGKKILGNSLSIEDRKTHVVINEKTVPFILTKTDFHKSCVDLDALREVTRSKTVDWVVFVAPVRQQEYIEMCFTVAKHRKWIKTDSNVKWNPAFEDVYPLATYAGYQTCSTEQEELFTLLDRVKSHCDSMAQGRDAKYLKYLKYTADDVYRCVLLYTCLKNDRLADCTFNFNEMVGKEENTFVYLLHSLAEIRKVAKAYRKRINKLKEASNLNLETYKESEEGEDRALEFHLLEFTEVVEESCLSILPHMMCEYLYNLTKKFKRYIDFVRKVGDDVKISELLLCAATEVVMNKCFQLLGIDRLSNRQFLDDGLLQSSTSSEEDADEPDFKKQKMVEIQKKAEIQKMVEKTLREQKFADRFITPSFVSGPRNPARNSRFELFGFRSLVTTSGNTFERGKLFGLISVADKYGFRPDGGSYLFERDFPYVDLFNFECCNAIKMVNGRYDYFGNSSSRHSVPFSSSIEMFVQLYATTEENNECFEVSNSKFKIDLSEFWGGDLNSQCGVLFADGADGRTEMCYTAIKDAVDTTLEVKFDAGGHKEVFGSISAFYGGKFSYDGCDSRACYKASLFRSKLYNGTLSLLKSELAVPKEASLIIRAYLRDLETDEDLFYDTSEFECVRGFTSHQKMVGYEGTTCSLDLTVVWK